ncbi:SgcJ/EcaC family oxidoreductase [Phenylobacterium sp.]|uniref:SgcJ/EcaC family oxidoreductase n=1 Tax=Phenylobacterium sp. TaxID=1871053 RepID=UPI0025E1A533|nr:SgcJ/EcaC family oxidoreductase [Phenylobacterium sp.]
MIRAALAGGLSLCLAASAYAGGPVCTADGFAMADDAAIQALEVQQARTWNAHDIPAYAALFTEDADVVNVLGWRWRGRAELEQKLSLAHHTVFRTSVLTLETVDIRPLAPDLAVVLVTWRMADARPPDGVSAHTPQAGVQTQVLRRLPGGWRITAFQNTNRVPERPFGAPPS